MLTSKLLDLLHIWAMKSVNNTLGVEVLTLKWVPTAVLFVVLAILETIPSLLSPKTPEGLLKQNPPQLEKAAGAETKAFRTLHPRPWVAVFRSYLMRTVVLSGLFWSNPPGGTARDTPKWPGPTALTWRCPAKAMLLIPMPMP